MIRSRQPQITPEGRLQAPRSASKVGSRAPRRPPRRSAWSRRDAWSIILRVVGRQRCGSATAPHSSARPRGGHAATGAPTMRLSATAGSPNAPANGPQRPRPGAEPRRRGQHEAGGRRPGRVTASPERDRAAQRVAEQVERAAGPLGQRSASAAAAVSRSNPRPPRLRLAEPREIGSDHMMILGQGRRHVPPHGAARADPMQKHERRAVPRLDRSRSSCPGALRLATASPVIHTMPYRYDTQ